MELEGKLIVIEETKAYGDNNFLKRQCVIETDGDYPQTVPVDFVQQKTEKLDDFKVGDKVKIGFNVRGNKWEKDGKTRYFSSIQGWKIDRLQSAGVPDPETATAPQQAELDDEDYDDLPF